ncbi:MAG: hypothetical protein R6U00_08845 [Prochlorococcaceae cyanobacterium]
MASSGLPALAAAPPATQAQPFQLISLQGNLLAERDKDDGKEKKKQNQQKPHKQKKTEPAKTKSSSGDTKKKSADKTKTSGDQKPEKKKISDKQRDKIYEQGRQDGLKKGKEKGKDKGYEKGSEAGYDKGFSKGKKKGKDKGYREAQRQQWKAWQKDDWKRHNNSRRNIWVTPVQYNRGYYSNPSWARNSNWGYNRPWGGSGWYGSNNSPSWSWWGGQALGWGINALTTSLIVNNAVNKAISQRQPTVVVPNSTMQLYYGSVQPSDETDVTFVVNNNGTTYQMEADCADGLLDGEVPVTLAEAELINTACQVAFGSI